MNSDLITAYVDNEIKDEKLLNEISQKIQSDPNLRYEFEVQSLCKRIVKNKVTKVTAPSYLKEKIISEIKPAEAKKETQKELKRNFLYDIFYKPSFSFATALVIVVAIVLITINRYNNTTPPEIDLSKLKPDNMFFQAINNYSAILKGQLAPQLVSNNSKEICDFFSHNGVNYSTVVPEFKEWKILGAVISEDKGHKLAHHVYVGNNNELIYVFQVDEGYINNIVDLDTDLVSYLDSGNCYSKQINNNMILFTKIEHNIFAVVANDDFENVKNNFCNLN